MKRAALLAAASALVCFGLLAHAADDAPETGVFTLFKFEQAIGEERYEIRPAPEGPGRAAGSTLTSKFSFEDRGSTVPLETTLQFDRALSPVHFTIRGETARISTIDTEVNLAGGVATIREGAASRREPQPPGLFTHGRLCAAFDADGADAVLERRADGPRPFLCCRAGRRASSLAAATM